MWGWPKWGGGERLDGNDGEDGDVDGGRRV